MLANLTFWQWFALVIFVATFGIPWVYAIGYATVRAYKSYFQWVLSLFRVPPAGERFDAVQEGDH